MIFLSFVLKNLLRRKVRSLLTVVGAAVAVGAVVALVGLSSGFERSYAQMFEARGVDLVVSGAGNATVYGSNLPESFAERIQEVSGVQAVSPALIDFISLDRPRLDGVPVIAWPADSFAFDHLAITSGRRLEPADRNALMLGSTLARALDRPVGGKLQIYAIEFHVVGIFEARNVYENGSAILLLKELQQAARLEGKVTGFQVVLQNTPDKEALAGRVQEGIEALSDDDGRSLNLAAMSVKDHASGLLQIRMAHAMAWMTSAIALLIGAVGILNTMLTSVFERTREIGILRALGWRRRRVLVMILTEAVALSLAGAGLGTAGAWGVTELLTRLPSVSQYVSGDLSLGIVAEGFLMAVLVGLFGGLLPALRAARLLPTDALRHE